MCLEPLEQLSREPSPFPQFIHEEEKPLLGLPRQTIGLQQLGQIRSDVDAQEFDVVYALHCLPFNCNR